MPNEKTTYMKKFRNNLFAFIGINTGGSFGDDFVSSGVFTYKGF